MEDSSGLSPILFIIRLIEGGLSQTTAVQMAATKFGVSEAAILRRGGF